ncbi:hypothetical protein D3C76_1680850 [compost metagenome]
MTSPKSLITSDSPRPNVRVVNNPGRSRLAVIRVSSAWVNAGKEKCSSSTNPVRTVAGMALGVSFRYRRFLPFMPPLNCRRSITFDPLE